MLDRRGFLAASAGFAVHGLTMPANAARLPGIESTSMRGSISAEELGLRANAFDDQSKAFMRLLDHASERDMPVFLPPGAYVVSNITLPARVRLSGVPGATRLIYAGDGHLLLAEHGERIELTGLTFDGANRWIGDRAEALVDLRRTARVLFDGCDVIGSGKHAIALEGVGGRVERCTISGAALAGIYSVEASGLDIVGNRVSDCANGGILVHRWQLGEDGTMVSGNRVERIAAQAGGTGQNGNGINVFRAGNVGIAGNSVADCAFSAIRANSAGNVRIDGNTCLRSGETAIYSEFSFEGALISANVIEGAANGINVVNFNEGGRMAVCSGNIVRNLSAEGPYPSDPPGFGTGISVEADSTVTGNVIENAPLYGIHLGWGEFMRNVVATGNVIRKTGTGIAVTVVDGTGPAVISDNIIDGAVNGAILGYRWSESVTGDLAVEGAETIANLTVERNRVS